MSRGLATTLRTLTRTDNEAALSVLLPALDSPLRSVREGALSAILRRRRPGGVPDIIRRLDRFDEREKRILLEHPGRLTSTLRDAVLGNDPEFCRQGCRAAIWIREYDLIPALLTAVEDHDHRHSQVACDTMMKLVHSLYDELASPAMCDRRRDPQLTRQHVLGALELSVQRFPRHQKREIVEAFLLLAAGDNALLNGILHDPNHAAFPIVHDILCHSEHGGVIRLLLGYLDDPRAPLAVLKIVAERADIRFLKFLLRKIGREPSPAVCANLRRIDAIAWVRGGLTLVDQLDEPCQQGAVRLALAAGIPRVQAFGLIEYILRHGQPGGRREAAGALAEFNGADANALAMAALDDADPQVQAIILEQLRRRGIPGALARVVEMMESPHALVRKVARANLAEFTFARYIGAFDMLDAEVRQSTGHLVRQIDPQAAPLLQQELESPVRGHRLRGVAMACAMGLVERFESIIVAMLQDDDHLVRAEAAAALGLLRSSVSLEALEAAQTDRSPTVREAVNQTLQRRRAFKQWRAVLADPRD